MSTKPTNVVTKQPGLLTPSIRLKHIEELSLWNSGRGADVSVIAKIRYTRKGEYFAASAGNCTQIATHKGKTLTFGHTGNVNSVDFSHSTENYLLTAGDDRYVSDNRIFGHLDLLKQYRHISLQLGTKKDTSVKHLDKSMTITDFKNVIKLQGCETVGI